MLATKVRPHSSKYRGVYHDHKGRWVARITVSWRKPIHLGTFDTEIQAALAFNKACRKYGVTERMNYIEY